MTVFDLHVRGGTVTHRTGAPGVRSEADVVGDRIR
jgi:hypothetical protein